MGFISNLIHIVIFVLRSYDSATFNLLFYSKFGI